MAHTCRPRPRPVLAPIPLCATPNTRLPIQPIRTSGAHRSSVAVQSPRPKSRGGTRQVSGRRSGGRQQRASSRAHASYRRRPHAHVILKATSRASRSRFQCAYAWTLREAHRHPPHRSTRSLIHTCLPCPLCSALPVDLLREYVFENCRSNLTAPRGITTCRITCT